MGVLEYWVWIGAAPERVWRTYVDPAHIPQWQTGKPVIDEVTGAPGEPGSTYVSRRGPLVELVILSPREAHKELATLKRLVERDVSA